MTTNIIVIIILLILNCFAFILGILCGKILLCSQPTNESQSFFKQPIKQPKNQISIDDTKYVVDIKTSGMEKKYDSLGETTESKEQITESINKLKNLKK